MFGCLFGQGIKFLQVHHKSAVAKPDSGEYIYLRQLAQPFTTSFKERSHPRGLLRTLGLDGSSQQFVVVIR